MMRAGHRPRGRWFALVGTMVLVLGGLVLGPAVAQEAEEEEPVEVQQSTIYVSPLNDVIPGVLSSDVPPAAICVVAAGLIPEELQEAGVRHPCHPDLDPIRDPLRQIVGGIAGSELCEPQDPDATGEPTCLDVGIVSPVQLLAPDTVAVSVVGGNTHYQSAIRFELPPAPSGEEYVRFQLTLPQGQPSYSLDSPAFRRIILGLFAGIGDQPNFMDHFTEGLIDALTDENRDPVETRLDDLSDKLGIEACPFTKEFEEGGAPEASPDEEMPRSDFDPDQPAIDCNLGAAGLYDPDDDTWTFDLSFAAEMWDSGELDNHGVLLRPFGVPNLAFGNPDTSTNAQVVLDISAATMTTETAEPPPPFEPFDPPAPPPGDPFGDLPGDQVGFPGADPPGFTDGPVDVPAVADPPPTAQAPTTPISQRGEFMNPWWLWLVLPALLGGGWLMTSALVASAAPASAASAGAMTRLIARSSGP